MDRVKRVIPHHDVTDMIGLRVTVADTAIEVTDANGDVSIEIPDIEQLSVAAAVARCLMPLKLRGNEMKTIRKIAGWTAADLALKMGEKTSDETISRWENERQPMGGYAEKVLRLVVCETLKDNAPGVDYDGSSIANLIVMDPWRVTPDFEIPHLHFDRVRVRGRDRRKSLTWGLDETDMIAA